MPQARAVDESDLLPVDKLALAGGCRSRRIEFNWTIAKCWLPVSRTHLRDRADSAFKADAATPEGIHKHDQFFGDAQIYHDHVTAILTGMAAGDASAADVTVKYLRCADAGACYPPQKHPASRVAAQGSGTIVVAADAASPIHPRTIPTRLPR